MNLVTGATRAFLLAPSFATAEALLDDLRLPVPYRALEAATAFDDRPAKRARRQAGGSTRSFIHNLSRIDLLHDIGDHSAIRERLVTAVLDDTTLSDNTKTQIEKECSRVNGPRTAKLLEYVYKPASPISIVKVTGGGSFTIAQDSELYTSVQGWYRRFQGHQLPIVLDGMIEGFVKPGGNEDDVAVDKTRATRSLAICAFLLILLGKHTTVPLFSINRPTTEVKALTVPSSDRPFVTGIQFLTGSFQKLDMRQYNKFMQKWIGEFGQPVQHVFINAPPSTDSRFSVYKDHVSYMGLRIPMSGPRWTAVSQSASKTNMDLVNQISSRMCMNYTKQELTTVFKEFLVQLTTAELHQQRPFISRMCDVNFFRDAYKADVAVQVKAVFITFDRIAAAYHSVINTTGIPGLFLSVKWGISRFAKR
jgi:hypothetical protein